MQIQLVHPDGSRRRLEVQSLRELDDLIGEIHRSGTWADMHVLGEVLLVVHGERRRHPRLK
jgi:hypothetical protein